MNEALLVMIIIASLGYLAGNNTVLLAAGILILMQVLNCQSLFRFLEKNGLFLGISLMLLAVMVPFATGKVGWFEIWETIRSKTGLISILMGILAAYLAGGGVSLLQSQPEVVTGLIIGSLIGILVFQGIPAGPIVAAGMAAMLLRVLH